MFTPVLRRLTGAFFALGLLLGAIWPLRYADLLISGVVGLGCLAIVAMVLWNARPPARELDENRFRKLDAIRFSKLDELRFRKLDEKSFRKLDAIRFRKFDEKPFSVRLTRPPVKVNLTALTIPGKVNG